MHACSWPNPCPKRCTWALGMLGMHTAGKTAEVGKASLGVKRISVDFEKL
jgi:hypothetical protein